MLRNQVAIKIIFMGKNRLIVIVSNCVTRCYTLDKAYTFKVLIQSREAYGLYCAVRGISWLTIHAEENP